MPSYSDGTQALWEGIIADFEADNPDINVDLEVQSWDNINDVVRNKVQSNEAPDILNIDAFAGFAGDDLLYKADEVVSDDVIDDLQDSFVENASIDGTQYGLPLIASARTMFVNKDLLEQAGVQEIPTTWDQLLEASKKISDLGGGVSGYGMPLGSEEAQAETSIWTFGAGGIVGRQLRADHRHPGVPGSRLVHEADDRRGRHPGRPGLDRPDPADQRVRPGQDRLHRGAAARPSTRSPRRTRT